VDLVNPAAGRVRRYVPGINFEKGTAMRNRRKTIESLRRLAERPGTPAEGETAHRLLEQMLEQMGAKSSPPIPPRIFSLGQFPRGTQVYYCYWCYDNARGVIDCNGPKVLDSQIRMRIKFDRLKQPRWVPVTSKHGCHIALAPFRGDEAELLYNYWADSIDELREKQEEWRRMAHSA
jgi:hypothetical protein